MDYHVDVDSDFDFFFVFQGRQISIFDHMTMMHFAVLIN